MSILVIFYINEKIRFTIMLRAYSKNYFQLRMGDDFWYPSPTLLHVPQVPQIKIINYMQENKFNCASTISNNAKLFN